MAQMISGWQSDDCWDPSHEEAYARTADGEIWHLHRTMGPAYGFTARPMPYNRENSTRLRHLHNVEEL